MTPEEGYFGSQPGCSGIGHAGEVNSRSRLWRMCREWVVGQEGKASPGRG